MISPVTVTILPGTGLPSTEAPMVVADQGSAGFSPRGPMALSQPPSGVIWGWRTPPDFVAAFLPSAFFSSAAVSVKARAAMAREAISDFRNIVLLFLRNLGAGKAYFTWKGRGMGGGRVRFGTVRITRASEGGHGCRTPMRPTASRLSRR